MVLKSKGLLEEALGQFGATVTWTEFPAGVVLLDGLNAGAIDWSLFCIDGSVVRAHQSAAGASKKKRRPASRRTTPWVAAGAASGRSCT